MKKNFLRTTVASIFLTLMANSPIGNCETLHRPFPVGLHSPNKRSDREQVFLSTIFYELSIIFVAVLA
jgi:hypothetical protein